LSNPLFLFAATAAVLVALAFALLPLVGSRHRIAVGTMVVGIPALTLVVYILVGTPAGIDPDTGETGQIRQAVTDLARRAMREPGNAEHWARLGLAYKSLEEFDSAEHAFRRALYIDNDTSFLQAELGETLLYASGERSLPEEARALLERAAAGGSQKALWLLGLDAYQREDYAAAIGRFERLLGLLPPDSSVRGTVRQYLQTARAGGRGGQAPAPDSDSAGGPSLALSVSISDELASRLTGEETVFVAVRRAAGGPPLAVRRLRAAELPTTLTIDDADAMMAGSGLSSADRVVIVARVSFSGDAAPAPGDFEGRSDVLPVEEEMTRAEISIDQVL
jgi:cytochrome c-type biogenesis protein CcmH